MMRTIPAALYNGTPQDKSDDEWSVYLPDDDIGTADIYQIAIDSNEDLWFATSAGLRYLHVER